MSAQRLNRVVKFRYFQQFATGTKTQSGTANPRPQSRPAADETGWERDRLPRPKQRGHFSHGYLWGRGLARAGPGCE